MTSDSREGATPVAAPAIVGPHYVRPPVSDVMRSHERYIDVLGFEPRLCLEEEANIVGVVVEVPDPDGHIMEFHTIGEPAADEA